MSDVLWILALFALGLLFWRQRQQAELATRYLRQYCQRQDLQLLSVARSRRQWSRQPLGLLTLYQFEFSSDGESAYQGTLRLRGLQVVGIDLPPFRMPD
ncbi:MAG: DUF3301 domain-containing protein [Aeromonas sp.]